MMWLSFIDSLEQRRRLEENFLYQNALLESILKMRVKLYVEAVGLEMREDTIILVGLPNGSEEIPESHYPEVFVVLPVQLVSNPTTLKLICIEDEEVFKLLWNHYQTFPEETSSWLTGMDGRFLRERFNTILSR